MAVSGEGTPLGANALLGAKPRARTRSEASDTPVAAPTSRTELLVLALFCLVSLWVLALDLRQVAVHGLHWTGTDGIFVTDQATYLGWIVDASHHWLAGNPFDLRSTPADFFQPLVFISGRLVAVGVAPWVALLVWKPFAVLGMAAAALGLVRATITGTARRVAALALALLFVGPGALVAGRVLHVNPGMDLRWHQVTFDSSLTFWSWGYSFGLIAAAAATFAILQWARGRSMWSVALLAALASSLHPWQGAELILTLGAAELLGGRRRWRQTLTIIVAAALPLLYFMILNRSDAAWGLAQRLTHSPFPVWMALVTLAPLAVPAALAYRRPAADDLQRALRVWPLATAAVFLVSETRLSAAPTHALLGVTIPLGVLAVQGVAPLLRAGAADEGSSPPRRQWIPPAGLAVATALVLLAVAPALIDQLVTARQVVRAGSGGASGPLFIAAGERRALDFLAGDPRPGGVLTDFRLGTVVPAIAQRRTWVGNFYYTPHEGRRSAQATALLTGQLPPAGAQALVRASGARFVLAGCGSTASLAERLGPLVIAIHHFGCATVLDVR